MAARMREPGSRQPPEDVRSETYHHGDLRSALLSEASVLLERDGAEAVSFRAIARAAGVSQTAPYNHFPNREALLAALAEEGLNELARSQRAAAEAAPDATAKIIALGHDYIAFALAHPQRYRLMFGVGVNDWSQHPAVVTAKKASFDPIRQAVSTSRGTAAANETQAVAAWALVHGLAMLLLDRAVDQGPEQEPNRLVTGALQTFTTGIQTS